RTTSAICGPPSAVSRPRDSVTRADTGRSTSTRTSSPCTSTSARSTTRSSANNRKAPATMSDNIPTPTAPPPDVLRCAYMELIVSDLKKSRDFYVDVLDLQVTEEDENAVYLRSMEEFIHHNLILRQGTTAAVAAFSYRVRSTEDVDRAEACYRVLGCEVRRNRDGFVKRIGGSVREKEPQAVPCD